MRKSLPEPEAVCRRVYWSTDIELGNYWGGEVECNGLRGAPVLEQTRDNNKANEIIEIDETTGPE